MFQLNNDTFSKIALNLNETYSGDTTGYYKINLVNGREVNNELIVKDLSACESRSNVFNVAVSATTSINSATTTIEIESGSTIYLDDTGFYDYYVYAIDDLSGMTLYNDLLNSGSTSELIEQGQAYVVGDIYTNYEYEKTSNIDYEY